MPHKIKNEISFKYEQPKEKELVESFSTRVDNVLNEFYGALLKGGVTAAKAGLKASKVAAKAAKTGKKLSGAKMLKNVGSAILDDAEDTIKSIRDASAVGAIKNSFVDDKGNFSFNPMRGVKKQIKGTLKTADNLLLGGLGQKTIDSIKK